MEYREGRLTVEAREQPLPAVLAEVSRTSGITFHLRQPLPPDPVTLSLKNVPAETAIKRLLGRDFDLVWAFDAPRAEGGPGHLAEVWVIAKGSGSTGVVSGRRGAKRAAAASDAAAQLKQRLEEIENLADADDPMQALPALIGLLNDPDAQIRSAAAEALGEVGVAGAVEPLGQALKADTDSGVREAAADALGELGRPEALPVLQQALKDVDSDVREAALDALAEIGGVEAERAIRQALGDPDEDVRIAAEYALARLRQQNK